MGKWICLAIQKAGGPIRTGVRPFSPYLHARYYSMLSMATFVNINKTVFYGPNVNLM